MGSISNIAKGTSDQQDLEKNHIEDRKLDTESLIHESSVRNKPKLLVCITMYNEPPKQLVESLIGVYRAYYELVRASKKNINKVQVVIVIDGYENLSKEDLMVYEKAGIYNAFSTSNYKYAELSSDKTSYDIKFKGESILAQKLKLSYIDLNFIHEGNMNNKIRVYGANNVAHCFSRSMKFPDWLQGFDSRAVKEFKINRYTYDDFLLGSDKPGCVKEKAFFNLPIPIHFVIKHRNQGKIESHKWFFKGFCEMMNPAYAQILD